jgi:hypothetical protein
MLEAFLNGLAGEVVSTTPNMKRTTPAQIYGGSRKIDFSLIVERVRSRHSQRRMPHLLRLTTEPARPGTDVRSDP